MMSKHYRLAASQIRSIAEGHGSCIASDHITVEGRRVGFMYREAPEEPSDSGWRFFSGEESQAYADEAKHFEIYDVNTIANYDPSIVPLLREAIGSAFGRDENGDFRRERLPFDLDA